MLNSIHKTRNELFLECDSGDSLLKIEYWDNGDMVSLCHWSMSYYNLQENWLDKFKKTMKILWSIVIGKEYCFYEICFQSKKQIDDFKEFVSNIDSSKMIFDE